VLFRGVSSDRDSASGTGARDTLDRRYARGEIDKNEYEQMKQSLK
jgi:uncharacterized membrane protein